MENFIKYFQYLKSISIDTKIDMNVYLLLPVKQLIEEIDENLEDKNLVFTVDKVEILRGLDIQNYKPYEDFIKGVAVFDKEKNDKNLVSFLRNIKPLPLSKDYPRTGDEIFVSGYPRGLDISLSKGIVSSVKVELIQTDAAINPGNSGGPIIEISKGVVAISTFGLSDSQGLNFGIAIPYISKSRLESLNLRNILGRNSIEFSQLLSRNLASILEELKNKADDTIMRISSLLSSKEKSRDLKEQKSKEIVKDKIKNEKKKELLEKKAKQAIRKFEENIEIEKLRENYLPENLKYVLITENPPKNIDTYFYYPFSKTKKGLYYEIMKALYNVDDTSILHQEKAKFLETFKKDGFFLIEALPRIPEERISSKQKEKLILDYYNKYLLPKLKSLKEKHRDFSIIIISTKVYNAIADVLKEHGFNVANKDAIPLPGSGQQKKFREKFKELIENIKP